MRNFFVPLVLSLAFATVSFADECGDANNDSNVTTADALGVLRGSVGGEICQTNPSCDVDCSREITATDALVVLRKAVGLEVGLECCVYDYCFYDEDCDEGEFCGSDEWGDARCLPGD